MKGFLKLPEKLRISGAFQVADRNIRLAFFSKGHCLKGKLGRTDTSADQIGVGKHAFHKAISGAQCDLLCVRLLHIAGRVIAHVDDNSLIEAVNEKNCGTA